MQEKVIEAIIALAGVRWMQAEEIQLVLVPRGAMVPGNGCIPDWHQWNAQIRLGGGKWGELAGEGKTSGEAMDALLRLLVSAHKAVDERRAKVLESSALKAQLDAVPTRGVSLGGKEVGVIFDESLPKESDESIALRDIANLLGFIGPPDSPQTVVKAVKEEQSERGAWMLNLANALGLPSGEDKTAILRRAWSVGGQRGTGPSAQ